VNKNKNKKECVKVKTEFKNSSRHVNRLDKIVSKNLHSNEFLVSSRNSYLFSTKKNSSVVRTSEDVPKPLTFVNVYRSKHGFSVIH
jgi:hypothetical protein